MTTIKINANGRQEITRWLEENHIGFCDDEIDQCAINLWASEAELMHKQRRPIMLTISPHFSVDEIEKHLYIEECFYDVVQS